MSDDLLNFDDDYDMFTDRPHGDAKTANKELDNLFEVNAGLVTNDSLDDILKPDVGDDIFKPKSTKKRQKSIRRSIRKKKTTDNTEKIFGDDDFDPFSPSSLKSETKTSNSDDSLDFLLGSQPLGTVPSCEDLLSLDPFSEPVNRPKDVLPTEKTGGAGPSNNTYDGGLIDHTDNTATSAADTKIEYDDIFSNLDNKTKEQFESSQTASGGDLLDFNNEDKMIFTDTTGSEESGLIGRNDDEISGSNEVDMTNLSSDIFDQKEKKSMADSSEDLFGLNDDDQIFIEADEGGFKGNQITKQLRGSIDSLDAMLLEQPNGTVPSNDDLKSLATAIMTDESSLMDLADVPSTETLNKACTDDLFEEAIKPIENELFEVAVQKPVMDDLFHNKVKEAIADDLYQDPVKEPIADDLFDELIIEPIAVDLIEEPLKQLVKDDLFEKSIKQPVKDDLFEETVKEPAVTDDLFEEPVTQSKEDDLLGEPIKTSSPDDLFEVSITKPSEVNDLFTEPTKAPIRQDDLFAEPMKGNVGANDLFAEQNISNDSKKSQNDNQPGSEKMDIFSKDSPTEQVDPERDIFGDSEAGVDKDSEIINAKVKATPVKGKRGLGKLKKRMESSFENLLHGLSDESEPELDEMIPSDDNDNTNLESILVSPSIKVDKQFDDISTPARHTSAADDMDMLTSTPKTEGTKDSTLDFKSPPVEVKVHTPEEIDVKSWEMIDQVDVDPDVEEEGGRMEEQGDSEDDDGDIDNDVMIDKNRSSNNTDSMGDTEFDLSAIEDTNHLDVDINKHKSALGKKALRRKPSRKSRRSVMTNGEDALFQDSTGPKSSEMINGNDDFNDGKDTENFDMSPPAKKPSPSIMVALPGMLNKPPLQRPSASVPADDDDAPKPAKRVSKPPQGAFILPDVMPKLSPKPSPSLKTKRKETDSNSHTFEKPTLRSAKPKTVKDTEKEADPVFDTPVLRSVEGTNRDRTPVVEDRDVMFEKPVLRNASKSREQTPDTKMETESGTFAKPTLRETPKKPEFKKKDPMKDTPTEPISSTRNLRSTTKPDDSHKTSTEKHTFDKPKLRSASRKESQDKTEGLNKFERSTSFETPVLRSAKVDKSDSSENSESASYTFEKPALKSTAVSVTDAKKDTGNVGHFDKPALRKTPSPEKEVKSMREVKGTFDKPSLRKTENSSNVPDTSRKGDYKSSLPEMKLRKTSSSSQKEVVPEKPSWLKEAADKQSKVKDVIQTKENCNNNLSKKELPSWLDKTPVLKENRGSPLQDTSNGQSEDTGDRKPSRSREPSIGSENDSERRKSSVSEFKAPPNNYVPSWMRQGRSPSLGGSPFVSPSISTPNLIDSNEVPQWKKDLAARKANRKEQSPTVETPKREGSTEPEWKKNIQLRKTKPGDTPSKDKQTAEPEWKKAAEERKARLRKSSVEN